MSVRVEVAADTPTRDVAALVARVTFGSAGLRYRRLDVPGQLARLHDPVFVRAREDGVTVGVCVLDRRRLRIDGREASGVYRGSLCVAPGHGGRGIGRALAEAARCWIEAEARTAGRPILSWGCVERGNAPSLAVLRRSGARDAGGLAMSLPYRQWPRERCDLESLAPGRDAREQVVLDASWADAAVRDVTPSRLPGYTLIDGDGVRISARVAETAYAIETMGKMTDALVRTFVTPFPVARRRFDPACFRHVRLVDVAVRAGCEGDWSRFVGTVLARHDVHFAALIADPTSALARRLRTGGKPASLRVMVRGDPLPEGPLALAPVDG